MSDHIPFEMQSEIIKKLPVKSLLQFRSVSKQWKSLIDNPKFIKNYPNPNPQKHHLLVWYRKDSVRTYTSIIDDNTFPEQKFPLTAPAPLNLLRLTSALGSVSGLICFYGVNEVLNDMVVLWNPSIRKCVGIVIPNVLLCSPQEGTVIGFGICPDTSDPKLVKVNVVRNICWEVQVFTLSSRVWKTVYSGAPFKSCDLMWDHVFIDGTIYWRTHDNCRFIVSFDLKSEKLGEVCLPERLVVTLDLLVAKVNGSLGLLEYCKEGETRVCGVWMRKDCVDQPFAKIYTVKVEGKLLYRSVLGFRNNGDVVLNIVDDDHKESTVEVYEPSSGNMNGIGIRGESIKFYATSYMETLLLLDESNSIIH